MWKKNLLVIINVKFIDTSTPLYEFEPNTDPWSITEPWKKL